MSARQVTSRLIHEITQSVATFQPSRPAIDREQLSGFAKAVLGSVDVRDLRGLASATLLGQLEELLEAIQVRQREEIRVDLRYDDQADVLVVETCLEDQPFLVSTMRAAMASEHLEIRRFLAAIVRVVRDPAGKLVAVGTGHAESVMRIEIGMAGGSAGRDGGGVPKGLSQRIEHRLRLAQAMVGDFPAMKAHVKAVADGYFAVAHARAGEEAAS
ncbi:MAG TPA: hypothetical protein VFG69_07695, partial [Nannocystaceae bacterium]|nr:hypothetical protein [Nannocystaceae bacterium]